MYSGCKRITGVMWKVRTGYKGVETMTTCDRYCVYNEVDAFSRRDRRTQTIPRSRGVMHAAAMRPSPPLLWLFVYFGRNECS